MRSQAQQPRTALVQFRLLCRFPRSHARPQAPKTRRRVPSPAPTKSCHVLLQLGAAAEDLLPQRRKPLVEGVGLGLRRHDAAALRGKTQLTTKCSFSTERGAGQQTGPCGEGIGPLPDKDSLSRFIPAAPSGTVSRLQTIHGWKRRTKPSGVFSSSVIEFVLSQGAAGSQASLSPRDHSPPTPAATPAMARYLPATDAIACTFVRPTRAPHMAARPLRPPEEPGTPGSKPDACGSG